MGAVEVERTTRETQMIGLRYPKPGVGLASLSGEWNPWARPDLCLTLSVANLFDAEARRHASFLKDYAPPAGRNVRVGLSAGMEVG